MKSTYASILRNFCVDLIKEEIIIIINDHMNIKVGSLSNPLFVSIPKVVGGVHFTEREIEVIACVLNSRSSKKISTFLNVSPRTVDSHLRNIIAKIDKHSREELIDFIEHSPECPFIKAYYLTLRIYIFFKQLLNKVAHKPSRACTVIYWKDATEQDSALVHQIIVDLEYAGIHPNLTVKREEATFEDICKVSSSNSIHILSGKALTEIKKNSLLDLQENQPILLSLRNDVHNDGIKNFEYPNHVSFQDSKTYYFSFFKLLEKFYSPEEIESPVSEFKSFYNNLFSDKDVNVLTTIPSLEHAAVKPQKHSRAYLKYIAAGLVSLCLISFSAIYFAGKKDIQNTVNVEANFLLPPKSILLNRDKLTQEMNQKLNQEDGIQSIAIIGPGGAGKTTLARQYATSQKADIVWEINAETPESLRSTFEHLADFMTTDDNDKQLLKQIKNSNDKDEKIILYVQTHLRTLSNWILIYDNVEKFHDIQNHFPQNAKVWGNGKVIITTRDNNIKDHSLVAHTLKIGELDQAQKFELFNKIMSNNETPSAIKVSKEETHKFLETVPAFPLDVSLAAYYLKTTNISYQDYLNYLSNYKPEFSLVQQTILKDRGDYAKTRYRIVTLAATNLIKMNKDFAELLLLISLLDSQHIPRELLTRLKDTTIVDRFIYELNKYSLVSHDPLISTLGPTFSIHRSTQEISLAHLIKELNIEHDDKLLYKITNVIADHFEENINNEDIEKIQNSLRHGNVFLSHASLLNSDMRWIICGEVGCFYYYLGNNVKAKGLLEKSIASLNESLPGAIFRVAHFLSNLANVLRELGDYQAAKVLFEKSLMIYKTSPSKYALHIAHRTAHLGNIYREKGDYETAIKLYENSYEDYKKYSTREPVGMAQVLVYLGCVYRLQGDYKRAKTSFEESIRIYKIHHPEDYLETAMALSQLGIVYKLLGDLHKAKEIINVSYDIHKKLLVENHRRLAQTTAQFREHLLGTRRVFKGKRTFRKKYI